MKTWKKGAICLGLWILAAAGPAAAGTGLGARIDAILEPYAELGMFNGTVLIAKDGIPVVVRSYGMASYEHGVPNGRETRYRIASISKEFTALAIAKLAREGRLRWESPVAEFLPDFPNGDRMTIRQLVEHSAGLVRLHDQPGYELQMTQRQDLSELVRWLGKIPLLFEPGTSVSYSSSYLVLARVIETVTGRSYGDFLRQAILDPLGLTDTGHETIDGIVPRLADGYAPGPRARSRRKAIYVAPDIKTGAGSLYSTVDDLLRFSAAWHRDPLFSEAEWNESVGPRERDGSPLTLYLQGRTPGYFSHLRKSYETGYSVIVLSNNYAWLSWPAALLELAEGADIQGPRHLLAPGPASPEELRDLPGTYVWPDGDRIEIVAHDGDLAFRHPTRGTLSALPRLAGGERLFTMFDLVCHFEQPAGARTRMVCRSHWHDERIVFERVGG